MKIHLVSRWNERALRNSSLSDIDSNRRWFANLHSSVCNLTLFWLRNNSVARSRLSGKKKKYPFYVPSSMIAVVTFFPVTPWAHAASTFKSSFGLPPFCPTFFKYHWCLKKGSVGSLLPGFVGFLISYNGTRLSTLKGL